MKTPAKLTCDQRRTAILHAVRRLFAEKGFAGATTRELAGAAGVSEALLFKHFPSKVAIYTAMQKEFCSDEDRSRYERIAALEPSASTLVLLVHFLVTRLSGDEERDEESAIRARLTLRSLAEDGLFARMLYALAAETWVPKVQQCVKAAIAEGKAEAGPRGANLHAWLAHHLAVALLFHASPEKPVVDYGVPRGKLAEQSVWFILRGLGLTDAAIRELYNPEALHLLDR